MITVQETTVWHYPNHIYYLDDTKSKALGYKKFNGEDEWFKTPLPFDKKGRSFITLEEQIDKKNTIVVQGSKGNVYYITEGKCSCVGFKYHGTCKHVKEIENEHN